MTPTVIVLIFSSSHRALSHLLKELSINWAGRYTIECRVNAAPVHLLDGLFE